ncbi:hypothetical protein PFFCH_01529 [Plasmodium falciparum FCH/4]|uniref:Uncharacterized protein n=1 Tax=Plasmodium falciparum FCH/4 TaxID=1036724 RepID=A0A024VS10_PLAFA|nr:hypothetical protein PFFCH_01529 [Plasmodium falciparum FCH/4]
MLFSVKQNKKKRLRNKTSKINRPRQKDLIYYVIGKEKKKKKK